MAREIKLLDTVALLQDLPEARLQRGQVGTVVEELAPDVFEVEFSDDRGQTYASLAVESSRLLGLLYEAVGSAEQVEKRAGEADLSVSLGCRSGGRETPPSRTLQS